MDSQENLSGSVEQGVLVGTEGNTGFGTGVHLHFQAWRGSTTIFQPSLDIVINPLDLYGLEMTANSINGSGLFTVATGSEAFPAEWTFLVAFYAGDISGNDRHSRPLNNTGVINSMRRFFNSIGRTTTS
jgi:murein DD-endopeptidase MepM/ murein hydrolase activator NlpD